MDDEQHMVVMKPASAWAQQAKDALDAIERANGGQLPPRFADADKIDHAAFASCVEALVALAPLTGRPVAQDLIDLAGLRPVDEILFRE